MTAMTEGEYWTWRQTYWMDFKRILLIAHTLTKAAQHSRGRLCSLRRAPPLPFVSAQQLQSERLGGTAAFPGSWAGLSGIAACSNQQDDTVTLTKTTTATQYWKWFYPGLCRLFYLLSPQKMFWWYGEYLGKDDWGCHGCKGFTVCTTNSWSQWTTAVQKKEETSFYVSQTFNESLLWDLGTGTKII